MIAAMRGAVYEALKREEKSFDMYVRLRQEAKDQVLKDFFFMLAEDTKKDMHTLKHLNLHSIIKFGLAIKFSTPQFEIDDKILKGITDKPGALDIIKLCIDEVNADIEYYEHISNNTLFPEVKRLFRIISDKELEHKAKLLALRDLLE
ncbi:hypothetical protein ACFL3V_00245 [Nanoarchaeota archaeon]